MKKLFWILVVLSLLGSAALLWLIKTMPQHDSVANQAHEADEHAGHNHASDEHHASDDAPQQDGAHDSKENSETTSKESAHEESTEGVASHKGDETLNDAAVDIVHEAANDPKDVAKPSSDSPQLSLKSDPSEADVYVDGEYYGKTPVQIALGGAPKELRLEKEGYRAMKEVLPPVSKATAKNLHWNLSLNKEGAKSIPIVTGVNGPAFVQLRALPLADFEAGNYGLKSKTLDGLLACKVEITGKGVWVRLLRGPYLKEYASKMLSETRKKYAPDAFVTGEQDCLP